MLPQAPTGILSPLKPLSLELQRGCDDASVFGGLGAYLVRWADELSPGLEPPLRKRLARIREAFTGYQGMSPEERRDLCERTVKALNLYAARAAARSPAQDITPASNVRFLRGVGPKRAALLAQLSIHTVHDLLRHYPLRYDDRRNCPPVAGLEHRQSATIRVRVTGAGNVSRPRGRSLARVPATDGVTPIALVWFNQPYRAGQFDAGAELLVTGQVMVRKGEYSITVAEFEAVSQAEGAESLNSGRIVAIYGLTAGVSQGFLRGLVNHALQVCSFLPTGAVPEALAAQRGLIDLPDALRQIHFPEDESARTAARARIAYEELFVLQAALAKRRRGMTESSVDASVSLADLQQEYSQALPFGLTGAQARVIGDIQADLEQRAPANRLIHGDVGSGKTVCAAFALLGAARAGKQAAMMAPTELLAEQHLRTVGGLLEPLGVRCRLLTGALGTAARSYAHRRIAGGDDAVIIGTQALFQEGVAFRDLAAVIIDEQHRFGVNQRAQLSAKGLCPNVFVMSATPIPRTLALTAYGDFDVSVLDELPPGRKPVFTQVAWGRERAQAYETVAGRVAAGGQAYIVCPTVDADAQGSLAAAESEYYRLQNGPFAAFKVGLLHGRIDASAREEIMEQFRAGRIEILVATTVIEVGVDVPNATVMLVENSERFGLAQLHQLRGRIGRGEDESICVLLTRASAPDVIGRLRVLERTNDGFEIAEEDLRRRGPGELTGTRQSGLPDLRIADLVADTATLVKAREDAFEIIQADEDLKAPEHKGLREALAAFQSEARQWAM